MVRVAAVVRVVVVRVAAAARLAGVCFGSGDFGSADFGSGDFADGASAVRGARAARGSDMAGIDTGTVTGSNPSDTSAD
ncbi:hypothetical protein OG455_14390 [Kitasatospora sp. NBC_01287]|uniref:hypothetical protein n=1 Tax=Kitasatospora sp. NBC_01287 TaxID=2903573 RepID=UPI00224CD2E5|nr:hypothetical protein [Kitasatospora sp. NBC_01287]MCX4746693.1 hypothetical protein [Kitasatospora sp. NBC_01287]